MPYSETDFPYLGKGKCIPTAFILVVMSTFCAHSEQGSFQSSLGSIFSNNTVV